IHAAQLLLLAQLCAVVGQARTALALDAARRHLQLALALEGLGTALEEEVSALATRELALRTDVTRHVSCFLPSDAPLLGRAAAVVRDRGDVGDAGDLQAHAVQRADRGLATRTGTTHTD